MAVKTFKTELSKGYELVRVLEGTFEKGYASADLNSLQTVFVPQKVKETYVRCSVTGLHLSNIEQHKTLRSYAATAVKAIGIRYAIDHKNCIYPVGIDYPVVLIQNQDNKWYALCVVDHVLDVEPMNDDFDPRDIGDDWEHQPYNKEKIGGWRYLTVNQSQSTNKRLMSIVDWFLKR